MKKSKIEDKSLEIETAGMEDNEDLDRFIEKRKIQNEALKKIADMNLLSRGDVDKKKKGK